MLNSSALRLVTASALALSLAAPAAFAQSTPPASTTPAASAPPATPAPDAAAPAAGAPATPAPAAAGPGAAADSGAPPAAGAAPAGTPPAGGAPDAAAPGTAPAGGAATPPPPPAAAPQTEAVANPYGLSALWHSGDFIARTVLIILMIMSLGSWYIMIVKFFEQGRLYGASKSASREFWNKPTVGEGASALKPASPFRYIADTGISATAHHEGALIELIDRHTWVTMSIQRAVDTIQSRLQGGLAFLATVGSTAPFVGLFGTVWGIYHALTAIGIAGQASIDKVAGPVGEALIMTAIGLATAVPAVLGYNFLVRRNKMAIEKIRNFSSDLHSVLLGGVRVNAPRVAGSSAPATTTSGLTRVA